MRRGFGSSLFVSGTIVGWVRICIERQGGTGRVDGMKVGLIEVGRADRLEHPID
jgi:hypothetical protein